MKQKVRASRRKHHIIYKTTCLVTGRYYIGMHSTDDLNDGYIGSGQLLWKSIKKYGKDQHKCEILEHLPDRDSLILREEQIVSRELLKDKACMNLRPGGTGNYPGKDVEKETLAKMSASMKEAWASGKMTGMRGKKQTPEAIAKSTAAVKGSKRSEEQKNNISKGLLSHYSNSDNLIAHRRRMSNPEVSNKKSLSLRNRIASETPEQREQRFKSAKERANRPEAKAKKRKLNHKQILLIRELRNNGCFFSEIKQKLNLQVSVGTISNAYYGKHQEEFVAFLG